MYVLTVDDRNNVLVGNKLLVDGQYVVHTHTEDEAKEDYIKFMSDQLLYDIEQSLAYGHRSLETQNEFDSALAMITDAKTLDDKYQAALKIARAWFVQVYISQTHSLTV